MENQHVMASTDRKRSVGHVMFSVMNGRRIEPKDRKFHRPFEQELKLRRQVKMRLHLIALRNAGMDSLRSVICAFEVHLQLHFSPAIKR